MNDQKNTVSASGNTFEQFCDDLLKTRKEAKARILQFLETAPEEEVNKFYDNLVKMCIKVSVSSIAKSAWEGIPPEQREQAQRGIRALQAGSTTDLELMYQGSDMKRLDAGDSEITISFTGPRSESVELVTLVGCEHPKFRMSTASGSDSHGWFQVCESGMVFPRRNPELRPGNPILLEKFADKPGEKPEWHKTKIDLPKPRQVTYTRLDGTVVTTSLEDYSVDDRLERSKAINQAGMDIHSQGYANSWIRRLNHELEKFDRDITDKALVAHVMENNNNCPEWGDVVEVIKGYLEQEKLNKQQKE